MESGKGHIHIPSGFQRSGKGQSAVAVQQRQGVQQAGDKLRADVPRQGEFPRGEFSGNGEGQSAFCAAGDAVTGQAVQIAADGALRKPPTAGKGSLHAQSGGDGNTKTQCRAGFPAMDFPSGNRASAGTVHDEGAGFLFIRNRRAHSLHRFHGGKHILAGINGAERAHALCQRRAEDGTVGGAFGGRHGQRAGNFGGSIGDGAHRRLLSL